MDAKERCQIEQDECDKAVKKYKDEIKYYTLMENAIPRRIRELEAVEQTGAVISMRVALQKNIEVCRKEIFRFQVEIEMVLLKKELLPEYFDLGCSSIPDSFNPNLYPELRGK